VLAGADLIFQWIGMVEYIPCYGGPAEHWGPLPATRPASRKILIERNIKKRTGPALCVLCGFPIPRTYIEGERIWSSFERQKVERRLLLLIHILCCTRSMLRGLAETTEFASRMSHRTVINPLEHFYQKHKNNYGIWTIAMNNRK
jgi:hypothetical protein